MSDPIDVNYTFTEYQEKAITDVYFKTSDLINELVVSTNTFNPIIEFKKNKLKYVSNILFLTLGVNEEAGEIAGKIKKIIRNKDGDISDDDKKELSKECGDVLWYLTALIKELGLNLNEVAYENFKKLEARKTNGTICGSGDNR